MKTCIDRRIEARIDELRRQRDAHSAYISPEYLRAMDGWDVRHKCAAAELRELEKVRPSSS